MSEQIRHSGIVESLDEQAVEVRIVQTSACSSCKASAFCSAAEQKEKLIKVARNGKELCVGETVTIVLPLYMGMKAVLWAFVFPFFLLMTTLIATEVFTGNDVLAAALCLLVLLPYYLGLYIVRNRLDFDFKLE